MGVEPIYKPYESSEEPILRNLRYLYTQKAHYLLQSETKPSNKPNPCVYTSHSKTYLLVLWNFDLICQPHGRRVIRTLKAIATVLQTAVDLHLYRSPGRCVRDSNPRGFYTQTVFRTAPSTYRTRNINLSFQIVRPPRSHFLIISKRQESSPAFQPESIRLSLYS